MSFLLTILGLFIVSGVLVTSNLSTSWPKWAWIWYNDDDGYGPKAGKWNAFVWLALRNPAANLRLVPGVSAPSRPLWYKTFFVLGKQFYHKIGWESGSPYYPVFSAGAGRGY